MKQERRKRGRESQSAPQCVLAIADCLLDQDLRSWSHTPEVGRARWMQGADPNACTYEAEMWVLMEAWHQRQLAGGLYKHALLTAVCFILPP